MDLTNIEFAGKWFTTMEQNDEGQQYFVIQFYKKESYAIQILNEMDEVCFLNCKFSGYRLSKA